MLKTRKTSAVFHWTTVVTILAFTVTHVGLHAGISLAQELEEEKLVGVFVLPSSSAEAQAALLMSRVLRENVGGLAAVQLRVPAPVFNESALPVMKESLDAAYRELNAKNVPNAMEKLSQIKPILEQILPVVPIRTVALFYKAWGVANVLTGNMAEARTSLEVSLTLWKDQSNLEYAYSVETLKLFNEVFADLQARPATRLKVETTPENAVVIVDAREPSQSPAVITNLTVGTHLVKVALDGYEQWAGFVRLDPGDENHVTVPLKAIPEKSVFDQRLVAVAEVIKKSPDEARENLLQLQQFLGVQELLVVECSVLGESYELKGFHVKEDGSVFPVKRSLTRDASFLAGVREFLSGLFESFYEIARKPEGLGGPPIDPVLLQKAGIAVEQTTAVFDPDNPVFPTVELGKPRKEKLTSKWWFWTGVGAALVGGGFLTIWLLRGGDIFGTGTAAGPTGSISIQVNSID